MSDRIEFDAFPPDRVRLSVCAWLRRHGVDPNMVAVPGWIERQPDLYRLGWESYVPDEDNMIRLNEARDDAVREARHVQLEGSPLPWPDELTEWVNSIEAEAMTPRRVDAPGARR